MSLSRIFLTRVGRLFSSSGRGVESAVAPTFSAQTCSAHPPFLSSKRFISGSGSRQHLDGTSSVYVEQMHRAWLQDPASVHVSWASYFKNLQDGVAQPLVAPPTLFPSSPVREPQISSSSSAAGTVSTKDIQDQVNLWSLIRAFQSQGHQAADLDPLKRAERPVPPELKPEFHGFSAADLERVIPLNGNTRKLKEVVEELKRTYCGSIGLEFLHIPNIEQVTWLQQKLEEWAKTRKPQTPKMWILDRLMWADMYERFLEVKFANTKRFGLEGCESVIPALKSLVDTAADLGVENMVFGMPHRGRLNFLANVMRKPHERIFWEFAGTARQVGSGDVKYHLGAHFERDTNSGKKVCLSLLANPSHLEAVNPVVEGKTRALQHYGLDKERKKSMSVVMHGDAAFSGQGVVYESLHLNDLPSYTTGGTIHMVVNNQIGFTTDPSSSRSTPYPTDVAKSLGCPILHVNGDDVDAAVWAAELAAEYRQKFRKSFVLDIVGYRKHGHNEVDAPEMTQPLMYDTITKHPSTLSLYVEQLINSGELTREKYESERARILAILEEKFAFSKENAPPVSQSAEWTDSSTWSVPKPVRTTGVATGVLKSVGHKISHIPEGFTPHKVVARLMKKKAESIESGKAIDWATAEALAFGTLILEGNHVRLSGQDVERGTFSHRHAVLHDQKTGNRYIPLSLVEQEAPSHATFSVYNSSLSEFGVLGFELGFSLENPRSLVLWEAQFGDFSNGAQIMFDQFLSSGEEKWERQNGIVCLLPHGYDGQGPEHSSARLERFLAMSNHDPTKRSRLDDPELQIAEHNWQVANVTTPANYFHLLRRQVHRAFRKPLIVMSPKNLLRHPECVSDLIDFDDQPDHPEGADLFFKRVIGDNDALLVAPEKVKRVLFCSGKIYYDLSHLRHTRGVKDVAIVRVEQLAPFPDLLVEKTANLYPNAEIAWVQEEPRNMGAFSFVSPFFESIFAPSRGSSFRLRYFGRRPAASPSTGYFAVHQEEQNEVCSSALGLSQ